MSSDKKFHQRRPQVGPNSESLYPKLNGLVTGHKHFHEQYIFSLAAMSAFLGISQLTLFFNNPITINVLELRLLL